MTDIKKTTERVLLICLLIAVISQAVHALLIIHTGDRSGLTLFTVNAVLLPVAILFRMVTI